MTTRIFLAGLLGAVAMFIWSFVAHMLLPLGEAGIREIPNETAVLSAMQTNLGERTGFFIFPGLGVGENPGRQQKNEAMKGLAEKFSSSPSGLLIYHPPGRQMAFGKWLGIEFLTELIESFLVVLLLGQTAIASFGGRVWFVTVAGILAAITTNVSYWNWYGFPTVYTVSYMTTQIIGFFCVGVVAALVLGRSVPQLSR